MSIKSAEAAAAKAALSVMQQRTCVEANEIADENEAELDRHS
jgi:hypothetical protein